MGTQRSVISRKTTEKKSSSTPSVNPDSVKIGKRLDLQCTEDLKSDDSYDSDDSHEDPELINKGANKMLHS